MDVESEPAVGHLLLLMLKWTPHNTDDVWWAENLPDRERRGGWARD